MQALSYGAWRSLVAHLLWEQGVEGSNPFAPTRKCKGFETVWSQTFFSFPYEQKN